MSGKSLDIELSAQTFEFVKLLRTNYQFYYPSNNQQEINNRLNSKLAEIFRQSLTLDEQYNRILYWCSQQSDDLNFLILKKYFLELNQQNFKKRLHLLKLKQELRIHNIKQDNAFYKNLIDTHLKSIENNINHAKNTFEQFNNHAQKICTVSLEDPLDAANYDKSITLLKRMSFGYKKLPFNNQSKTLDNIAPNDYQDIQISNKKLLLHDLGISIEQYKTELKNEPWYKKVFGFFSPARYRRLKALNEYDKNVNKKDSIDSKYQAAAQWFTKQNRNNIDFLRGQSRFSTVCMKPFKPIV